MYFEGNVDGVNTVTNYFAVPITAKRLRVYPGTYKNWKYMDLEILGENSASFETGKNGYIELE